MGPCGNPCNPWAQEVGIAQVVFPFPAIYQERLKRSYNKWQFNSFLEDLKKLIRDVGMILVFSYLDQSMI